MFIFLAAITALARAAPETERRADLLDLASWTMARTDALGKANSNDDIQRAVDAFLSQNVSILINGASISRSAFIESLESALAGRVSSAAIYSSIIEVPADPTSPATAGSVGVFFKVHSVYAPSEAQIRTFSENIIIQQDPSIPVPVGGSSSSFDARRVVSMDSVVTVESQAGLLADLENVAVM